MLAGAFVSWGTAGLALTFGWFDGGIGGSVFHRGVGMLLVWGVWCVCIDVSLVHLQDCSLSPHL
jgi:hypothetical protein